MNSRLERAAGQLWTASVRNGPIPWRLAGHHGAARKSSDGNTWRSPNYQKTPIIGGRIRSIARASAAFACWFALVGTALAQSKVPSCDALTLYGNAANSGLCKGLGLSKLWICELTQNSPDIHTTFNETVGLHITVRHSRCEGKLDLTGAWNAQDHALMLESGKPSMICNVNLQNYVDRLNAQARLSGAGGDRAACITAFATAASNLRISASVQSFLIGRCKKVCK